MEVTKRFLEQPCFLIMKQVLQSLIYESKSAGSFAITGLSGSHGSSGQLAKHSYTCILHDWLWIMLQVTTVMVNLCQVHQESGHEQGGSR